jgi:hypothetical protein
VAIGLDRFQDVEVSSKHPTTKQRNPIFMLEAQLGLKIGDFKKTKKQLANEMNKFFFPIQSQTAIQCSQPPIPLNGKIDGTSGAFGQRRYAVGALLTFSCNEGNLLIGEGSIVCTETGFWSHPPPLCK